MTASGQAVKPRPVSRPAGWWSLAPKDSWRHSAAGQAQPKGIASIGTRLRRLVWSWWPWAVLTVWATVNDEWWWASGAALLTLVAYLTAPAALPPRYGLDHDFGIDAEEFLPTMAGATGMPSRAACSSAGITRSTSTRTAEPREGEDTAASGPARRQSALPSATRW